LLPPSVGDVLGVDHLCFFIRRVVAKLNLSTFREEYGAEGGPAYAPEMLVSVWLYAYVLGVTSSRRLEQRIREDLAFRYLAAGAAPDHWTLNAFRRRHGKGLNDLFTQVVEVARKAKMGKLGHVAIDSTRIGANASRDRIDTEQALRDTRVARWLNRGGCGSVRSIRPIAACEGNCATRRAEGFTSGGKRLWNRCSEC